jgi:CRP-like cAMP-binding protein
LTHRLLTLSEHAAQFKGVLAQVRHFDNLPTEVQDAMAAASMPCHFTAGQVIYLEGEPAEFVYILERGWVKATRMSRDGREQAMLFLKPGEIFGDIAVFTGMTYPGTVTALEGVDAWMIPSATLMKLVKRYPDLALAVIHKLGERVLHYIELVENLSLRSVEARLANTLLQHVEEVDGQLVVLRRAWTTFDEMAVRLGTVRDVLSRALKTLESDGLLKVKKHEIIVLDAKRLAERGNL